MIPIDKSSKRLLYPGVYNVYPITNEVSGAGQVAVHVKFADDSSAILDDYYGRIFGQHTYEHNVPYGTSGSLDYYPCGTTGDIVGDLRVPYRKVPIFSLRDLVTLDDHVARIKDANPGYDILIRGQTKTYYIDRPDIENMLLYGELSPKEPSFLPSHLRNDFDELFLHCMWHSQASILLNDIVCDASKTLSAEAFCQFKTECAKVRRGLFFTPFALGIAQHYGMPSVGLDLTKTGHVAAWFALNSIVPQGEGIVVSRPTELPGEATIFVFRCPKNAVFPYANVRPKHFPSGRPDRQDAWFCHVGWGDAKNQLASYLVCAFRLDEGLLDLCATGFAQEFFPRPEDDPVLQFFLTMKGRSVYEGDAKRAIDRIYTFAH